MKTKSNRVRYLEQSFTKNEAFSNDPVSFIFWVIGMIVFIPLYGATQIREPTLTFYDGLFIVMLVVALCGGLPFFIWQYYEGTSPHKIGIYFLNLKNFNIKMLAAFAIGFVAIMSIDFSLKAVESLTSIEEFLFFTFAAVSEEFFYRYFIATIIFMVIFKIVSSLEKSRVIVAEAAIVILDAAITTIITSIFFYYSHFTAYAGQSTILLGVFLGSIVLTTVYLYTKSILVTVLMHLLINFIYGAVIYFGSAMVIT